MEAPEANGYPPELALNLQPLIDELHLLSYSDLAADENKNDPESRAPSQVQMEIQRNLLQTISELREQIRKAIDTTKSLTGCDMDSESHQKLLLSMGIALTAKRQLINKLKLEMHDILNEDVDLDVGNVLRISYKDGPTIEGVLCALDDADIDLMLIVDGNRHCIMCKKSDIATIKMIATNDNYTQILSDFKRKISSLKNPGTKEEIDQAALDRKEKLLTYLNSCGLSMQEEVATNVLSDAAGLVEIRPPYRHENCYSLKETLLKKLKSIVD
ncbi:hypothetical protein Ciccas_004645 [Cichlidogyrus casuarinus]|uniref:Uncharacterized protein n=1 Tax=Cichlidogyrus casuarinus TaxID=1844966 RepID=A0ABD2QAZ0_9PLAT